jgi:hypothetical protein
MNSTSNQKLNAEIDRTVTDIIIILDESHNMESMGDNVHSVNIIFNEQKNKQEINDSSTATLVTFNDSSTCIINGKKFSDIDKSSYTPHDGTVLNDTICNTIKYKMDRDKPDNVVHVIITYGRENSIKVYTYVYVKRMIKLSEDDHFWKVIFIGANIDTLESGGEMNVKPSTCLQFDKTTSGSLLSLCKTTRLIIQEYRRSRTDGFYTQYIDTNTEQMFNKWPLALKRERAL